MTTIIGIKTTSKNLPAVVLGADTCLSYTEGNVLCRETCKKFVYRKGLPWIFAHAGFESTYYSEFKRELTTFRKLPEVTTSIDQLTDLYYQGIHIPFRPVEHLLVREQEHFEANDDCSDVLLAVCSSPGHKQPDVWTFNPKGKLRSCRREGPFYYHTIGSGSTYVQKTLEEAADCTKTRVDLSTAIYMVKAALIAAQKDSYTRGYHLAVLTPERIYTTRSGFTAEKKAAFEGYCASLPDRIQSRRQTKVAS